MGLRVNNIQTNRNQFLDNNKRLQGQDNSTSNSIFDNGSILNLDNEEINKFFNLYAEDDTENEKSYANTTHNNPNADDIDFDIDGIIDASYQSGSTGDCWLLTGLNSLSYSKEGQKAIKDAVKVNDDGSVSIYFKGLDLTYTVSKEEIEDGNRNRRYSLGDDDVLAFEIAIEDLREDIATGKVAFAKDSPYYIKDTSIGTNSALDGGYTEQVWYLLTGKLSQKANNANDVKNILNQFENNSNTTTMSCHFKGGDGDDSKTMKVKDNSGNAVDLHYSHAYSIKSVDGDTVTIVNPWDSTEEIVLDRKTFEQIAAVSYCDLSENNKDKSAKYNYEGSEINYNNIFNPKNIYDNNNNNTSGTNSNDSQIAINNDFEYEQLVKELMEKYNKKEITYIEMQQTLSQYKMTHEVSNDIASTKIPALV